MNNLPNDNPPAEVSVDKRSQYVWRVVWLANLLFLGYMIFENVLESLLFGRYRTDLGEWVVIIFGCAVAGLVSLYPVLLQQSGSLNLRLFKKFGLFVSIPVVLWGGIYALTCSGKFCEIGGVMLVALGLGSLLIPSIFYLFSKYACKWPFVFVRTVYVLEVTALVLSAVFLVLVFAEEFLF